MQQEDLKNLMGWLQAIHKESQGARSAVYEMKAKVDLLPDIQRSTNSGTQDSSDAERKIDDFRNHLEGRVNKMEDTLNDLRNTVRDIQNKVNHLK